MFYYIYVYSLSIVTLYCLSIGMYVYSLFIVTFYNVCLLFSILVTVNMYTVYVSVSVTCICISLSYLYYSF